VIELRKIDIIRAWRDPEYRNTLSADELLHLPSHPAGLVELSDEELGRASGMYAAPSTTAPECTMSTFSHGPRRCCP
jgi:mersacidin/lichenicidin family type 2 lantibiotic